MRQSFLGPKTKATPAGRAKTLAGGMLLGALSLLPAMGVAASAPAPGWLMKQTHGMMDVHHLYTNNNYGFQVAIPAGTEAFVSLPPSPNHGVEIILGDHRTIEVFANFDSALYGSSAGVLNAYLNDEHASGIAKTTALLGGKSAVRARFSINGSHEDVVIRCDQSPDNAIDITAVLTTTQESDEDVFSAVLASFRYVKRSS